MSDCDQPPRRKALKQIGGWVIYTGALTTLASCGRTPLGEPYGIGDDDDDGGTTLTPTPTPTPTPVGDPCGCTDEIGVATGLNRSDIPLNALALETGRDLLICHDALGYYAMSSLCSHTLCPFDQPPNGPVLITDVVGPEQTYRPNDLAYGFRCNCHGSRFDGEGKVTQGPATNPLLHYRMRIAADGSIFVDTTPPFAAVACRCT